MVDGRAPLRVVQRAGALNQRPGRRRRRRPSISLAGGMVLPMPLCAALLLLQAAPPKPPILSRKEWGSKPVRRGAVRQEVDRITIHHGGVAANASRTLAEKMIGLQAWSQRDDRLAGGKPKPAWVDIPYHFVIGVSGQTAECRPVKYMGDTNTEYSPKGHLLIMVEGDFDKSPLAEAQWESLKALTLWAAWKWKVPADRIQSHRDYSRQTTCPGKALYEKMGELRACVSERLPSR